MTKHVVDMLSDGNPDVSNVETLVRDAPPITVEKPQSFAWTLTLCRTAAGCVLGKLSRKLLASECNFESCDSVHRRRTSSRNLDSCHNIAQRNVGFLSI